MGDLGSNPNVTIIVYHKKGEKMLTDYNRELESIEKELEKLRAKKQNLLDEVKKKEEADKKKKEAQKTERYNEVQEAYNKFLDLLEAYENDFNEGYCVSIKGEFH